MKQTESSLAIANYFIQKAQHESISVTPMKILKLVYISHGWHLGIFDAPLIEEPVLAWQYGPVVSSVYHEFKRYGNTNVDDTGFVFNDKMEVVVPVAEKENWDFLDKVWAVYRKYSGVELSALTHEKGTPWDIVWNDKGGSLIKNAQIPNELIKEHYKHKIAGTKPNPDAN
jgi:uncharacterized phage-associated protein